MRRLGARRRIVTKKGSSMQTTIPEALTSKPDRQTPNSRIKTEPQSLIWTLLGEPDKTAPGNPQLPDLQLFCSFLQLVRKTPVSERPRSTLSHTHFFPLLSFLCVLLLRAAKTGANFSYFSGTLACVFAYFS
ncbi:hypothetical protein AA313_de0205273 [Arthrobotrys entomopaga]|nr:hypothetical protein AA313_de0205273 [Arthrobotrys entomopaga]